MALFFSLTVSFSFFLTFSLSFFPLSLSLFLSFTLPDLPAVPKQSAFVVHLLLCRP